MKLEVVCEAEASIDRWWAAAITIKLVVFPPLGIYFGYKAKQQIAQTGERGVELANAGLVVGWIFTVISVLFIVVWCAFMGRIISDFNDFS